MLYGHIENYDKSIPICMQNDWIGYRRLETRDHDHASQITGLWGKFLIASF
jgi:hypothetical protein